MGRLVRDDRKETVTQITTRYNQGVQNTISGRTTRQTLKQMGYSQWCSLVFCSEYTVNFSYPVSYSPVPEQPLISTSTLTKQGSTLTFIFRSSCAANLKKIRGTVKKRKKSAFPVQSYIGLLKVIYRDIFFLLYLKGYLLCQIQKLFLFLIQTLQ